MARRNKKHRRSGSKKLPLAIVVPMAVAGVQVGQQIMAGNYNGAVERMTGYDPAGKHFDSNSFLTTYAPIAVGVVVHKVAGRAGVNRYIPKWLPLSI